MEGQKNTIGATIRLQGSEEYVKRMQGIKQATRELREENERLNQSLKETVEQWRTWKVQPVLSSATLEDKLIRKSLEILGQLKISQTEEKIIADTIHLIEIRHGMNYCER